MAHLFRNFGIFAQPNEVLQSYVFGLPHSTLHLVIFVWDFSKSEKCLYFRAKNLYQRFREIGSAASAENHVDLQ